MSHFRILELFRCLSIGGELYNDVSAITNDGILFTVFSGRIFFYKSYLILLQTKGRIKLIKSSFSKTDVFEAFLFSSSGFRIDPMVFFSPVFNFSSFV